MKKLQFAFLVIAISSFFSCTEYECQACTKTIRGVAGTFVSGVREFCNDKVVKLLRILQYLQQLESVNKLSIALLYL